jgi:hypothetical protein
MSMRKSFRDKPGIPPSFSRCESLCPSRAPLFDLDVSAVLLPFVRAIVLNFPDLTLLASPRLELGSLSYP